MNLQPLTVTFVFTDIEGSTRLLRRVHDAYAALLVDHHAILDRCFEAEGGRRLSTEGDGGFFVFPSTETAARATVAAQAEHESQVWPGGERVRVRMGIHTGIATPTPEGGFVGLAVHLAARLTALGHGGQVLITDTARQLVGDAVAFVDLGMHSMADFPDPIRIYQVRGTRDEVFPPLQSALEARLPSTIGRLFGREPEIDALSEVVGEHRLVTVLGPGGTGKTRLVVETARRLRSHGVPIHFVDLTAVATVELMPSYVGAVLEVAQDPNLSPAPQIATALGRRRAILVLDNCEHLMPEVARFVASILEADPNARILATSRIPLAVGGERLFDLDPLAVDPDGTSPAIQLFADRAADVAPEFVLDEVTLPHVRAIVTALDGLPLAIELAASMLRILPVSELAAILPNRLDLLEGGDARPDRHRSLAAALRWNVESLDQATRDAFVTLGVMTGPFSIDDVAGVVGVGMRDAIRIAAALTDHSLLKRTVADGRTVLRMLETIRWFALESLGDTEQAARDRHLDVFRKVAIEARKSLRTSEAPNALARLWPRRSNVLTAFEYALQVGRLDAAIELIEGLVDAWAIRATGREARIATTKLIESVDSAPPELQLRALFARLEVWQNQGVGIAPERALAERAHALAKEVGDAASKVRTRIWMMGAGVIRAGDPKKLVDELIAAGDERALGYGMDGVGWLLWWADRREEAIDVFRTSHERAVEHGDPVGRLDAAAGMIATSQTEAEVAVAASLIDELAGVVEALGCRWWEGFRLQWAASHSRSLGHLDESLEWLSRAYEVVCERGTINQIAFIASHQAAVAWDAGKVDLAYAKTVEFADANRQAAENAHNPFVLEMAAGAAVRWGRAEDAARLCGAAAAWRRPGGLFELGMPMPAWDQERHDKVVSEIETALEGEDVDRLMKEGEAMEPDSALTLAMALRRPD